MPNTNVYAPNVTKSTIYMSKQIPSYKYIIGGKSPTTIYGMWKKEREESSQEVIQSIYFLYNIDPLYMMEHYCRKCSRLLTNDNSYPSDLSPYNWICKDCSNRKRWPQYYIKFMHGHIGRNMIHEQYTLVSPNTITIRFIY